MKWLVTLVVCLMMVSVTIEMEIDIPDMPINYLAESELFLEEDLVAKEPIGQFKDWYYNASRTPNLFGLNNMVLGTVSKNKQPSSRFVHLKSYGKDGFVFFTDYRSRKGREIKNNPKVALTFYWDIIHRSVRIEGTVKEAPGEKSDKRCPSGKRGIERGAYLVVPERVEFWAGQTNRLHDRIVFRRKAHLENIDPKLTKEGVDGWFYERLEP